MLPNRIFSTVLRTATVAGLALLLTLSTDARAQGDAPKENPEQADPPEGDAPEQGGEQEGDQEGAGDEPEEQGTPPDGDPGEPGDRDDEPEEGEPGDEEDEEVVDDPEEIPIGAGGLPAGKGGVRLHFLSTQKTYAPVDYDLFSAATRKVVGSDTGAMESRGEAPKVWIVEPGLYKVVRAGEPYETRIDFVTVEVTEGYVTDYVVVVDLQNGAFRGGGLITEELPDGVELAGIRLALSGGGNLLLNQKFNVVGRTSGLTALLGLFGNFGLIIDHGPHLLDVSSSLQLNLTDLAFGRPFSTTDLFEGSATYTYKLNNPYVGPYVRGGFRTRVFPGYLYVDDGGPAVTININRRDGTVDTRMLGGEANLNDLRLKLSEVLAPFILEEEIGANLKAVDIDLLLLKIAVGTRFGFGFRQGITSDLLVVDGDQDATIVNVFEIDNYDTLGPVIGANAKVTFFRWLFGAARFNMMIPVKDTDRAGDNFGERLLITLTGTGGLKIPAITELLYASFDYSFRLERDGYITSRTQFDHTLMARLNVTIF